MHKDHSTLKVGKTLTGIIADWSDQQASGLEKAVGKSVASEGICRSALI